MTGLYGVIASETMASEQTARYEILRSQAIDGQAPVARHGLAVMRRQGMAAWMDAWSKLPEPPSPRSASAECRRPSRIRGDSSVAVVHVLAAMACSHIPEVRV